jgi:drug/metabolite transporter (DMT)-like permease
MHHLVLRVATWILSRLVPKRDREPLIGDFAEEYALRMNAASSSAALKWYLQQTCASVPPLLWLRLTRATWLATLGVAFLAYFAVGVAQLILYWAITSFSVTVYSPLGLIIVFPIVVLIGYFAEGIRRRSAIVLGVMMLLAMTAMTVWTTENAPLWYRVAYFFVGPAAAVIGSALRSLRPVSGRVAR